MTKVFIRYKDKEKKLSKINKKNFTNIKLSFHSEIYKFFGLHYDSYDLVHNNDQINNGTIINLTYLNIDDLCLVIKKKSEFNCFKNILGLDNDNLDNSCFFCGLPKQNDFICSHYI
jgi:hypothetical protein